MDTIVALSTPVGRGGIGVIRLSGQPLEIALKIFSSKELNADNIIPKYMYFGKISAEEFCDLCYMVYFKAPKSYTGEDIIEFHIHGGVKIAEGIISAIVKLGARPAEKGEFTKRAFLNGKLTLADAEGVIDMINADSTEAVRAAYRTMSGYISRAIENVQRDILALIANLEVALDFPEEIDDQVSPSTEREFTAIIGKLQNLLKQYHYGNMIKNGIAVLIVGDTNVGKSSLMNAMLGYDRAIVSNICGTTRDLISDTMEYKGKKIILTDSAGVRDGEDVIEKEGVNRTISAIEGADLIIRVYDASQKSSINDALENAIKSKKFITVYNKKDLVNMTPENGLYVSAKTGDGVKELMDKIVCCFEEERLPEGEILTSSRHYFAVSSALEDMKEALEDYNKTTVDCVITSLNNAWAHLGEITGVTLPDDVLNYIFEKFCVGK